MFAQLLINLDPQSRDETDNERNERQSVGLVTQTESEVSV